MWLILHTYVILSCWLVKDTPFYCIMKIVYFSLNHQTCVLQKISHLMEFIFYSFSALVHHFTNLSLTNSLEVLLLGEDDKTLLWHLKYTDELRRGYTKEFNFLCVILHFSPILDSMFLSLIHFHQKRKAYHGKLFNVDNTRAIFKETWNV